MVNSGVGCGGGIWLVQREVIIGWKVLTMGRCMVSTEFWGEGIVTSHDGIRMRFLNRRLIT